MIPSVKLSGKGKMFFSFPQKGETDSISRIKPQVLSPHYFRSVAGAAFPEAVAAAKALSGEGANREKHFGTAGGKKDF